MGPWGTLFVTRFLSQRQYPDIPLKCSTKTFSQWNMLFNSLLYSRKIRSLLFPQISVMSSKINCCLLGQKLRWKNVFHKLLKSIRIIIRTLPLFTLFDLQTLFEKLRVRKFWHTIAWEERDSFQVQIKLCH